MTARMLDLGADHCFLDATGLDDFDARFPTIAAGVRAIGLDPARDWLPVAPAAHYLSGGIVTDLDGAASVPGLWACGEAACTGVHGANRLASNSLLEGMVFAPRVIEAIDRGKDTADATGAMRAVLTPSGFGRRIAPETVRILRPEAPGNGAAPQREALQRAMTDGAGVLRSAESLEATCKELESLGAPADEENRNLLTVAHALLAAAGARTETRGAHARTDHPQTDPAFQIRLVLT
jgi:L-aspartate oxidase